MAFKTCLFTILKLWHFSAKPNEWLKTTFLNAHILRVSLSMNIMYIDYYNVDVKIVELFIHATEYQTKTCPTLSFLQT